TLRVCLNWGVSEDLLTTNPLYRKLKIPPVRSRGREALISQADYLAMLDATDDSFRPFLIALRETGCRPEVLAKVRRQDYHRQDKVWVLTHWKNERHGEPLIVPLSDTMVAL